MGLFNKLFGFRWSLYIVRNENELIYAMHENSVIRIIGYCMSYFIDGENPVSPWSLHLNFNKKHKSFKLQSSHITPDGENFTDSLIKQIETIDPGYRVKGGEPIFINARTKKQLEIHHKIDYSNLQKEIDNAGKLEEPTFFSIMDQVFGKNKA